MNQSNTLSPPDDKKTDKSSEMITLAVVCAVQFLTPFMMSAVGVALPAIGKEFNASAAQLGLVEMVYILAVALLLLPMGRLGDIHGRKKIFITGICIFCLSTLMVAMAWSIETFILFRFIQGAGSAMITGTSVAILSSVFPPEKRGWAMGIIVGCVYLGLSAGPVLAGIMVAFAGWQWIFYTGAIIQLAALCLTLMKLKGEWVEARGEKFDFAGSLIYIVSLFAFITGALNQQTNGYYLALMIMGCAGLGLFFFVESRTKSPLLNVDLILRNRVFAFSNLATLINYAASFGLTFFLSLYLQYIKGMSPQATGAILIVQPLIQAVLSPVTGRLSEKIAPPMLATAGMIICAAGLGIAASVTADTPQWVIQIILVIMGLGFALFSSPNIITVMGSVSEKDYGIASGFVATMRTTGMLISMTIITLVFKYFMGSHSVTPELAGKFIQSMHICLLIFCILCIAGIFCSLGRIKEETIEAPATTCSA